MRGIIVAVSPEGVIGLHGKIPWHYSADLKRFKRVTLGSTIIMGRLTWESIGRPLPKRRNIVVTSRNIAGVECFSSIPSALSGAEGDVWFIGGAQIYQEAMAYCNVIDLTYVPDPIVHPDAVCFPPIDSRLWRAKPRVPLADDARLERQRFTRLSPSH